MNRRVVAALLALPLVYLAGAAVAADPPAAAFTPPAELPAGPFGAVVAKGERIFVDTGNEAKGYVGNGLACRNCHLDRGRLANAAPMWGAHVLYPQYRAKNQRVVTMAERIQDCFRFSMNGKPPAADSEIVVALQSYFYWLAGGLPTGAKPKGQGYLVLAKSAEPPDRRRGAALFAEQCALCHGTDGQGTRLGKAFVFPPLWGPDSYNWGAGMTRIATAAGFIRANMPLGHSGLLTDQQAWDLAAFIDSHRRPQDPRFTGSLEDTRAKYHADGDFYGQTIDGVLLGGPSKGGATSR